MPVSAFHPSFIELLRRASLDTIEVPVANRGEAYNLRQRVYKCRTAMKLENHEAVNEAERVTIRIAPQDENNIEGPWKVIAGPVDSKFDEALAAAGIAVPEAPNIDALDTAVVEEPEDKEAGPSLYDQFAGEKPE